MNGEYEQCNSCKHIWEHEDDACPECGSQDTWEFDIVTEFKALQKKAEELKELLKASHTERCTIGMLNEVGEFAQCSCGLDDRIKQALNQ